ncbi:hypothetical protein M3P05_10305 [Sansalvadorimonas sp. 2012CJ34-2]|uniref:Uncharacterized protein n=1 Tax=Parendozoicomonas callyspongiae TaxID=2942213 RepID=A0ABT0PH27_9GAMM|nr:hypothetical protein [Sansalvadorimonas sp. 2012CJ34-2]MCL6270311.1 hypothetical protein [Sansalvadorimonas sp. 2012CJ34-2]
MKNKAVAFFSWVVALWTAKVFLGSLPYKFLNHPDTQHIFGTIGEWMKGILGQGIGEWFAQHGAVAVGAAELAVSALILLPGLLFAASKVVRVPALLSRRNLHGLGGLAAAGIMTGAAFFHLATPLGIEVLHQGKSDGGSLFYAAVSILVLGLLSAWANFALIRDKKS